MDGKMLARLGAIIFVAIAITAPIFDGCARVCDEISSIRRHYRAAISPVCDG